ncbi:MAG: hypothetical protein ABL908_09000 [Hyphomicrobium sp.]
MGSYPTWQEIEACSDDALLDMVAPIVATGLDGESCQTDDEATAFGDAQGALSDRLAAVAAIDAETIRGKAWIALLPILQGGGYDEQMVASALTDVVAHGLPAHHASAIRSAAATRVGRRTPTRLPIEAIMPRFGATSMLSA